MTDQEKIELLNKLIELKRGRDQFFEKFDALFGVGHGFPGASDGSFDVFNRLLDEYSALVAAVIGDTKDGLEWFIYDNECGEKGMQAGIDGEDFREIRSIDDYLWLVELDSARIFCKKQSDLAENNDQSLWIAHPDGSEEEFARG